MVAIPAGNELLSSWLDRTAVLHGVQRHHLLAWSGYRGGDGRQLDYNIHDTDAAALAHMMRPTGSEIHGRTHTWLGRLRDDVVCRTRYPISCQGCADRLQALHGAPVRLKHWTEAWHIRCLACGDILSQDGEGAFTRELTWHWYDAVIAAADRGSAIVEDAIDRQRAAEGHSAIPPTQLAGHANLSVLPADVQRLFWFDSLDPQRRRALSGLSFAHRLFHLAAVGAQRRAEAEYAGDLFRVWLVNRRVQHQIARRRRRRDTGFSLRINVNSRLAPGQSHNKISKRALARRQSHN